MTGDAARAPDAGSMIYVGGFLTLYDEDPQDERLRLPRDVVARELRRAAAGGPAVPLNINHDESSTVGTVRLFDAEAGLFCLGRLSSPAFLGIVEKAAGKSKLVARGPAKGLEADPVVEYLSAGFPALSLSSFSPDAVAAAAADADTSENPGEEAEGQLRRQTTDSGGFFRHVSLCGLGRRRGTLAVYGRDRDWIVGRFAALTPDERAEIARVDDAALGGWDGDADPFGSDSYGLLASTVDDGYIAERLCRLRYDKRLLGLQSKETYVKASELPAEADDGPEPQSIRRDASRDSEERAAGREEMAQSSHGLTPAAVSVPGTANPAASAFPADCVYLSRDALMSILAAAAKQNAVPGALTSPQQALPQVPSYYGMPPDGVQYHLPPPPPPPSHHRGGGGTFDPPLPHGGYGPPYHHPDAYRGGYHHPERDPRGGVPYEGWYRPRYDPAGDDHPSYNNRRGDRYRADRPPQQQPLYRGERNRRRSPPDSDDDDDDDDEDLEAGERTGGKRTRQRGSADSGRKRRRRAAAPDDDGGDLSLPGERGYPKRTAGDHHQSAPPASRTDEFGEVRATLNEIRKDISQIRAAARAEGNGAREDAASVGSSDQKCAAPPPGATEMMASEPPAGGTVVARMALDPAVAAATGHTAGLLTAGKLVNASCEPTPMEVGEPSGGGTSRKGGEASMLEVNKRMFVSLLNKME
ncbi:assembly protein [Muromegalovirus WP15B]|uniref:Capsid scaffolding protein n=1 Tax=Muromegalovirus WP15B TaxID=524651 RepID=B3UXK3_MUHV1|nr:assembly protein [Muromegalovirus WP15B]